MSQTKISLLNFLVLFISSTNCHSHENNRTQVVMFVLGDSLFDPGNTNFLNRSEESKANHWPYGETFFQFPTGRFCDGRIVPDFVAKELGLPLWKPYLGQNGTCISSLKNGANFAAAGARAIPTNNSNEELDFIQQVDIMKNVAEELRQELGESEANKTLSEAVYLISIGGVDYLESDEYPNSTESQRQELVEAVIGNLTQSITKIYDIGGRKFAFQNVGPMGCLPGVKQKFGLNGTDECIDELLDLCKRHNVALLETAQFLESTLEGFQYSVFDFYDTLYDIIKNHTIYGFKEADAACCASLIGSDTCGIEPFVLCKNVSEYVFFDGAHQGERVNIILSQLMWNGDTTITVPRNFRQLFELNVMSDDISFRTTKNVTVGIAEYVAPISKVSI